MSSTDTRKKKSNDNGKVTKGKLFNKLSSLFKSNKNPKKPPPPAIESENLALPEDDKIDEENKLTESTSGEKCSEMKIRNVTIELEADGNLFDGDRNDELCTENIANRLNINSSHLTELTKMPLFILDSDNKLLINPEIKIQAIKPNNETETKMVTLEISNEVMSREKIRSHIEKFKFKRKTSCCCHEKKFQDGKLSIVIKSPSGHSNAQKSSKCKSRGTYVQESLPFLQHLVKADSRKHSIYKNNKQKVVFLLNPRSQLTSNESVDCTSTSTSKSAVTTIFSSIDYPDSYCSSYTVNTSEDSSSLDIRKVNIKALLTSESTQEKISLDSLTSTESKFFDKTHYYNHAYCVNSVHYECFPNVIEKEKCNHVAGTHKNPLYLEESKKFKKEIAYLLPLTSLPPNDVKRTLRLLKNAGERYSQMVNNNGEKKRQRKRRPGKTPCHSSNSSSSEEPNVIKNATVIKRQHVSNRRKLLKSKHSENKKKCEKKHSETKACTKKHTNTMTVVKKVSTNTKGVEKKPTGIKFFDKEPSHKTYAEKELQTVKSARKTQAPNHFLGIDLKINKYQNPAIVFCNIAYDNDKDTTKNILSSKRSSTKPQTQLRQTLQKHTRMKTDDKILTGLNTPPKIDQREAILKTKESLNNWICESVCYGTRTLLQNRCFLSAFPKNHCAFFETVSVI